MSIHALVFGSLLLLAPSVALADFNFVQIQAAVPQCKSPAGKTAGCPEQAISIQRMTAGQTDLQFFAMLGYRSVDASAFHAKRFDYWDLGVGARWFPRAATFWLSSRIPVRATAAGTMALGINGRGTDDPIEISAGLAVSGLTPRGALLEGFFRATENQTMVLPGSPKTHLTAAPHGGARLSVFF